MAKAINLLSKEPIDFMSAKVEAARFSRDHNQKAFIVEKGDWFLVIPEKELKPAQKAVAVYKTGSEIALEPDLEINPGEEDKAKLQNKMAKKKGKGAAAPKKEKGAKKEPKVKVPQFRTMIVFVLDEYKKAKAASDKAGGSFNQFVRDAVNAAVK